MKPIRLLAAALAASAGLALSLPASAAPVKAPAVAEPSGNVILVGSWDRDSNRWTDTDRQRSRDGDRKRGDRSAQGDRRWDDRSDRRWDRRAERRDDRWERRSERRDDRWDKRRDHRWEHRHDRGNHYGWDRGRHYGWDRDHKHYKKKHKRWHAGHHPRHRYWAGRRLPRTHYVVIERYNDYYLPPPRRGHYYARVDNDVFLVAQATHLIVDAFVLLDAASRN
jgi:Ni/Co efflux regulator RcnB